MKGLSFSEPMVKAWMEGRKTVTRRLIKLQPIDGAEYGGMNVYGQAIFYPPDDNEDTDDSCLRKPRYHPGETVYIKEMWGLFTILMGHVKENVVYKADDPKNDSQRWRSPRFMPEWAARSHALIVSVRPEKVREITEDDVEREGIRMPPPYVGVNYYDGSAIEHPDIAMAPEDHFARLWESLHPGSWERNDWVWRVELEKLEITERE